MTANLSPDELIVWQAVKGRITGNRHRSRYEAFTHWMHDHPESVTEILTADADRWVDHAIANEEAERERLGELRRGVRVVGLKRARPSRDFAGAGAAQLRRRRAAIASDVPF